MWKRHYWRQKCRKGLLVIKAMAAKGIECHLKGLYLMLSVTDYGLGLTMLQINLKLDSVQNEGITNGTPTETMHARPPTNATDRKWNRSKHTSVLSKILTTWSFENNNNKGMQTWMGQILDGSSRGIITASMPADSSNKSRCGKGTQTDSLWDTPARKFWKALLRMVSRQKRDQASHLVMQDLTVYTDCSVTKDQSGQVLIHW